MFVNNNFRYENLSSIANQYSEINKEIKSLNKYELPIEAIGITKNNYKFSGYQELIDFSTKNTCTEINMFATKKLNDIIEKINDHHESLLSRLQEHINLNMRLIYSIKKHAYEEDEDIIIIEYISTINEWCFGIKNLDIEDVLVKAKKNEKKLTNRELVRKVEEFDRFPIVRTDKVYKMAYEVCDHVYNLHL